MKFDCGESAQEKLDRVSKWHPWFAWYPVRVNSHDCRWLEMVERYYDSFFEEWYYRSISK